MLSFCFAVLRLACFSPGFSYIYTLFICVFGGSLRFACFRLGPLLGVTTLFLVIYFVFSLVFYFRSFVEGVCRACRIWYDDVTSHNCLLIPLCARFFMLVLLIIKA